MTKIGLVLLCLLMTGCVSEAIEHEASRLIEGDVTMRASLPRTANVEVSLLTVVEGKVLAVGEMHYRLDMLPVTFSMRLNPQFSHGELFLRARLRWDGKRAVQAKNQQRIIAGKRIVVQLSPLPCYPECL